METRSFSGTAETFEKAAEVLHELRKEYVDKQGYELEDVSLYYANPTARTSIMTSRGDTYESKDVAPSFPWNISFTLRDEI